MSDMDEPGERPDEARDGEPESPRDAPSPEPAGPGPRPQRQEPPKPAPGPRPEPRPEGDEPFATRRIESVPAPEPEETAPPGPEPKDWNEEPEERGADVVRRDQVRRAAAEIHRRRAETDPEAEAPVASRPPEEPRRASEPETTSPEEQDRFRQVMAEVASYTKDGYGLMGMIGYPAAGKTHAIKAFTHLLPNFDVDVRDRLGALLSPDTNSADVDMLAYHGSEDHPGDQTVFLDAGGELYSRLRRNEWDLLPESKALLHALGRAKGLLFMVALHPGYFRMGGDWVGLTSDEKKRSSDARKAQEEQGLVDLALLFLRAVRQHEGEIEPVVELCRDGGSVSEALREYRDSSRRLDIPVAVLFTKADQWVAKELVLAAGDYLAPHRRPVGVAPFAKTHLEFLYASVSSHARRFRFDFAQSYFTDPRRRIEVPGQQPQEMPVWERDGEPMSVGLLPALEYLLRNKPREDPLGRLLRRLEIDTATAHRIHRMLHPKLWRDDQP